MARHAPRLARTYCRPLIDALLPLLDAPELGDLAEVAHEDAGAGGRCSAASNSGFEVSRSDSFDSATALQFYFTV